MDEQRSRETRARAIGYAAQAAEVEPGADATTLRADAVDVVQRFITALAH